MPTTIINPAPVINTTKESGMGFFFGMIALVVFVVLFYMYGLPLIRQGFNGLGSGGVNINLPKTVDVNIKQSN
ncbi:hypothetical protein COY87_04785 [Candidatus Roizmanbacteria bacterium CG_4_10_14_0_8_um_filter_33_9]|uniref:Uncharacterized protein n=1 Tax=Candidatus Roizmanbacteria bacterium CG_4_10_14_0_8_um_filter_33_9 TaxID=1974826 RepID=A0A2M7QI90_9BACT|nr:MAG: hypothetical protein COY87_04785 [Candidatus Roizmanbacteria bacterium CG_4_10_14_0_8_um_filter_33_9]